MTLARFAQQRGLHPLLAFHFIPTFYRDSSTICPKSQGASSPGVTFHTPPQGPAPCAPRPHVTSRCETDGAQKRKQAELKKKKTDALPKITSFFPTNQLESGKDYNVCQESQSLSSVRTQIDKNSTTGTSDDHFDDDEINSEIKKPVPVPDKSEPVIVAIPEVSKIELVNSNKKTCWAVDGLF
ncbi:hypothetical protein EVAR_94684_1 [Eumeta japonica]|uniref:Uncharacterized protein n=1 Tax=Eumeta variegata TaxID=151549 RepID=A0A4C1UXL4_EUMVA|nr:hypothetical protein EVAR_94684_1 [Eumeta japonica]